MNKAYKDESLVNDIGVAPERVRIIGIDPGLQITGYGVLESVGGSLIVLEAGVIRPEKSDKELGERLVSLAKGLREVLVDFQPDHAAMEQLFAHYQHPRTAILMGHARGVFVHELQLANCPLVNYLPTNIKKTVTNADGWGTIKTPFGEYKDVLRLKTIVDQIDTVISQFGKFPIPRKTLIYRWLSTTERIPVMEIQGTIVAQTGKFTPTQVRYRDGFIGKLSATSVEVLALKLYPNPGNGVVMIAGLKPGENWVMRDVLGRRERCDESEEEDEFFHGRMAVAIIAWSGSFPPAASAGWHKVRSRRFGRDGCCPA